MSSQRVFSEQAAVWLVLGTILQIVDLASDITVYQARCLPRSVRVATPCSAPQTKTARAGPRGSHAAACGSVPSQDIKAAASAERQGVEAARANLTAAGVLSPFAASSAGVEAMQGAWLNLSVALRNRTCEPAVAASQLAADEWLSLARRLRVLEVASLACCAS